tara:strand:- start:30910 stop:31845 length:936 start_codon:yes stop_codon:yes gene_type:complete
MIFSINFETMKKIVVTGSTGFVGSNLVELLSSKGYDVYIIIRNKSNLERIKLSNDQKVYVYDGKIKGLINFFKKIKPEKVFHLASYFVSEHNSNQIDNLINSNLSFGLHVLEAMKFSGTKKMINTGTSWQHYKNENYNPVCLYAATKQAFESLIDYYVKAELFKVITLKLFDTYGETDNREKLINVITKEKFNEKKLKMSPGNQCINLTHISDVCKAFILAGNQLNQKDFIGHKKYAVSNKKSYKIKEVISLYESISGDKMNVIWGGRNYRKREVMLPWNKGEKLPKWNAKISLEEGLKKLYNYKKANLKK